MTPDEHMRLKIAEAREFKAAKLIELANMVQEHEREIRSVNAVASHWREFSPAQVMEVMAESKEREKRVTENERLALIHKQGEAEDAARTRRLEPIDRLMWAVLGFALGAMTFWR